MIVHIALFKWKRGITADDIDAAVNAVRSLKTKVDGLIDIRCGENFSPWSGGYTHAFVILARDRQALEDYRNHPDHVTVAAKIDEMDAGSIGVDFEDWQTQDPV